jgi:DNA-binding LacI/PurR family transcriptional regulator
MSKIKDVAQHAGVSSATVSRVLNGDARVGAESRERVMIAVKELGYQPNRVARNLRRQQTDTIGVVVSDIENPHFTQAVRVIEDAAFNQGYRVLLCNTDETPEKQRAYLETLAAERVRGIILAPADAADPMIGHLLALGVPVVAFDRGVDYPLADAVIADNHFAAIQAVNHLRDSGCRHIGFIGGRADIQTGQERLAGYIAAIDACQALPMCEGGSFRVDGGFAATTRLLTQFPEIDGLVVANNLMTIGAMKAMRELDREVGEDISLVGFDDPVWAEFVDPPITALVQPVRRMAAKAIELLFERIEGVRTQPRTVVFTLQLLVRASSGKLPATP